MTPHHKTVGALLAGVLIGAAALQGLHAQAAKPAYVVVAVEKVTDAAGMKTVMQESPPTWIGAAGGRYIIRTDKVTGLHGAAPTGFAVIAFDSMDEAKAWANGDAQKDIVATLAKSADTVSFLVEGLN